MGGPKHNIIQRMKSPYVSPNKHFVMDFSNAKPVNNKTPKNDKLQGTLLYKFSSQQVKEETFRATWNNENKQYDVVSSSFSIVIADDGKIRVRYILSNDDSYPQLQVGGVSETPVTIDPNEENEENEENDDEVTETPVKTGTLKDLSSMFDDEIDLSTLTFEDFKKDLARNNCKCVCYTDEIENNAIIHRFEGVSAVFTNAVLAQSKEELYELVDDTTAIYTLIALNDSCKSCVSDIAELKLNSNMNILNVGVNDITSENKNEIKRNDVPLYDAVSGASPACQADALSAAINGHYISSSTDTVHLDTINILVITHGDSNTNPFWKEFEDRLFADQQAINFHYTVKLIIDPVEHENYILNELILNEGYQEYSYVASTVRTIGISQKMDWLSNFITIITFNTYVENDANGRKGERGITHVGNTPKAEGELGILLALSLGKDVLNTITLVEHTHYNIEELQNQVLASIAINNCPKYTGVVATVPSAPVIVAPPPPPSLTQPLVDLYIGVVVENDDTIYKLFVDNALTDEFGSDPYTLDISNIYRFTAVDLGEDAFYISDNGRLNEPTGAITLDGDGDYQNGIVNGESFLLTFNTLSTSETLIYYSKNRNDMSRNMNIIDGSLLLDLTANQTNAPGIKKKCLDNVVSYQQNAESINRHLTINSIKDDNKPLLLLLNTYYPYNIPFLNLTLQWYRFFGAANNELAYLISLPETTSSVTLDAVITYRLSNDSLDSSGEYVDQAVFTSMDLLDFTYEVKNALDEGYPITAIALNSIINKPKQTNGGLVANQDEVFTFLEKYDYYNYIAFKERVNLLLTETFDVTLIDTIDYDMYITFVDRDDVVFTGNISQRVDKLEEEFNVNADSVSKTFTVNQFIEFIWDSPFITLDENTLTIIEEERQSKYDNDALVKQVLDYVNDVALSKITILRQYAS